jgi:hypothetical protein
MSTVGPPVEMEEVHAIDSDLWVGSHMAWGVCKSSAALPETAKQRGADAPTHASTPTEVKQNAKDSSHEKPRISSCLYPICDDGGRV